MAGQLFCDAALAAPGGAAVPAGAITVNSVPPTKSVYTITASGLKPSTGGDVYEVWALPEVRLTTGGYQLIKSEPPVLLGVIRPSVGAPGRLAVEGVLPQAFTGSYRTVITLQPPSVHRPVNVVLHGDAAF
jgi:hypothetical protein